MMPLKKINRPNRHTEKKKAKKLLDIALGNDLFLALTPKAQKTKAKTSQWAYFKLESFCIARKQ